MAWASMARFWIRVSASADKAILLLAEHGVEGADLVFHGPDLGHHALHALAHTSLGRGQADGSGLLLSLL